MTRDELYALVEEGGTVTGCTCITCKLVAGLRQLLDETRPLCPECGLLPGDSLGECGACDRADAAADLEREALEREQERREEAEEQRHAEEVAREGRGADL